MNKVDRKFVEAELRIASPPKVETDSAALESSKAEADLVKHIEDALLMDSDRTATWRE